MSNLLRSVERATQVFDEVVRILQADREPDRARADPGRRERGIVHPEVRRRGGMDHERLRVADVGEMREHAQAFDKTAPGRPTAPEREAEDRAAAPRQELLGERVVRMARQLGIADRSTAACCDRNSTTLRVFSTWRAMRSGSVSMPCRM